MSGDGAAGLQCVLGAVAADRALGEDFQALCASGGRFAGSDSERAALDLLAARLAAMPDGTLERLPLRYCGWRRGAGRIERAAGAALPCVALVRSPATPASGLVAEVLDLGRGTPEDFDARAGEIAGRIVMVRHEYMFASGTIHRRRKYARAVELGAAGFLIACPWPGNLPVTGSSGAQPGRAIPAAGISAESAARIPEGTRVTLILEAEEVPDARTQTLVLELPGAGPETVVLSAHVDGHHLGDSAMDNASGLAAVLSVARALAPMPRRRSLRVCLFSIEEWALEGSRRYVEALAPAARESIAVNLNLDSVAGSAHLTAVTSGYPRLAQWVHATSGAAGLPLRTNRALMQNSDHYNFAVAGVPALRLVAGFDEPTSDLRYVLTPADTADKVPALQLKAAALATAALAWNACTAPALDLRAGGPGTA